MAGKKVRKGSGSSQEESAKRAATLAASNARERAQAEGPRRLRAILETRATHNGLLLEQIFLVHQLRA
jgi:hypothetical protein